jgi:NAD-dependent SIR2 family protein deacetylase
MFFRKTTTGDTGTYSDSIARLKTALAEADAVVIGAGAGLSTSAGFVYSGKRFEKYFSDFREKYSFQDMYSGGFYPFPSPEVLWAFWSRNIWVNRYQKTPKPVYEQLLALLQGKDYFVITTNVDHCFQKAGFDRARLFYTQGDYGLFQCSKPCHNKTYDNEESVRRMILSQGWEIGDGNALTAPEGTGVRMEIDSELVPVCPVCGRPMTMNLRVDDTFVEDEGWRDASARYQDFLRTHNGRVLYLELGVGFNTPVIIKYPFWSRTEKNADATYACINYGDADCPGQIRSRSICIDGDIGAVLQDLK